MTQTGDRAAFLGRLRHRLRHGVPHGGAHAPPAPPGEVPLVRSLVLDREDLPASFERAATAVAASVHRVAGEVVPVELLADLVRRHAVQRAVVSAEPAARAVGATLEGLGVVVSPLSTREAAEADLGVTSATFGIAATGSVVQEADVAGGRTASLLPRIHLCLLPSDRLVATTAEVLRRLPARERMPSNLVLITGPSRSGDIEQIITLGVHGPTAVHVLLLGGDAPG